MELSVSGGTTDQTALVSEAVGHLLIDMARFPFTWDVSFVDDPASTMHNEVAITHASAGSAETRIINRDLGNLWDPEFQVKLLMSDPKFLMETVIHELGHAVWWQLSDDQQTRIAALFHTDAATMSATVGADNYPAWRANLQESFAETFKEACLPRDFREMPARTTHTITYEQFPEFRAILREAATGGQGGAGRPLQFGPRLDFFLPDYAGPIVVDPPYFEDGHGLFTPNDVALTSRKNWITGEVFEGVGRAYAATSRWNYEDDLDPGHAVQALSGMFDVEYTVPPEAITGMDYWIANSGGTFLGYFGIDEVPDGWMNSGGQAPGLVFRVQAVGGVPAVLEVRAEVWSGDDGYGWFGSYTEPGISDGSFAPEPGAVLPLHWGWAEGTPPQTVEVQGVYGIGSTFFGGDEDTGGELAGHGYDDPVEWAEAVFPYIPELALGGVDVLGQQLVAGVIATGQAPGGRYVETQRVS